MYDEANKKLIVVPGMKIKKCLVNGCEGKLVAESYDFSKESEKNTVVSGKRCSNCGMNYMYIETYRKMKHQNKFHVLNSKKQLEEMHSELKNVWLDKQLMKNSCVGMSSSMEEKRYVGNSLEKSFVKIDVDKINRK